MKKTLLLTIYISLLTSCNTGNKTKPDSTEPSAFQTTTSDSVRFAAGFRIQTRETHTRLTVINPWKPGQILEKYNLVPKNKPLPPNLPEGITIRTPVERTISAGAVQCSFLNALGALGTITGVCEPQYINNPAIRQAVAEGRIADTGRAASPDLEKIMLLNPEIIFSTPIEETIAGRAATAGIPTASCLDHMESTPLGRAEWIRFYSLFFEKRATADSLFAETVSRYNHLKTLAENASERPTVFSETIYSGTWWLPGGNSYMAHFFRDAGADYIWKDDNRTGSIGLPFEAVLSKAGTARYWLIKYNSPRPMTKQTLAADNPNYKLFDAWKTGSIFAANLSRVPYYEELPVHPDYVLQDMIIIFHPEALPAGYSTRYYEQLD